MLDQLFQLSPAASLHLSLLSSTPPQVAVVNENVFLLGQRQVNKQVNKQLKQGSRGEEPHPVGVYVV